jgi:hypothetical protein
MRKMKNVLKLLVIVPTLFLLFSCNPLEDDSKSDSMLVVMQIVATDIEKTEVNFLESDVVVLDAEGAATVVDDAAVVTLTAKTLDPNSLLGASQYNDIIVDRYVVSYFRSDGKNQEGVDVPYSFEGALSALVEIDSQVDISFVVVRAVAKLEPPLIDLRDGRGEGQLKVTAKIDFYGKDTIGNRVKATGYLTIFFANYADKKAEPPPPTITNWRR